MRRNKIRNKKQDSPKRLGINLARIFVFISLILLVSGFILRYIWDSARLSDYFKVKEVIVRPEKEADLSFLKGRNIFNIDLNKESNYLLQFYPDCNKVSIVRILPDRLLVDFIKRKPIAFVKLNKYFAIDSEGVFFNTDLTPNNSGIPVIIGLETKISGPKPGKRYNIKEISFAISILKEFQRNSILRRYRISKLDLESGNSASVFIPYASSVGSNFNSIPALEIKISSENIKNKITILTGMFMQWKSNLSALKYIDLRFDNPVLKLKDDKTKQ